nr:nucleotide-binding, alpha-beta plait [Tanacetum cinerariifolium]
MNQNNEDHQLSVFKIDVNNDETDVVFLEQACAYHQQLVAEENHLPLTWNLINRDREGAEERLMADYFNDHCRVRPDATGRMSLSVIMKCTAAIRQLAYGTTPDAFDEYLQMYERTAPPVVPYMVNGVGYEKGYYLVDGIYPQWATFVKSFTVANDAKHAYFKKRQEGAQKDVERAFGVLQGRWGIIQQPARSYHRTWIEMCETQRRKNKEMRDRDTHWPFSPWSIGWSVQGQKLEHVDSARSRPYYVSSKFVKVQQFSRGCSSKALFFNRSWSSTSGQ